jgi:hypothetical protein
MANREYRERALMANRKAAVEQARHKLAEVDALLAKRRLQQRASSPRIIRKVLDRPDWFTVPARQR